MALSMHASAGASVCSRERKRALHLAALFLALASTAGAQTLGTPDAVAVLELGAPDVSPFVLRGNVPVPKGTYPRADGKVPLGVRDWDGTLVPAQLEIVSLYPGTQQTHADVVEVIARVHLAPGTKPGDRVQYSVVPFQHAPGSVLMTQAVSNLVAQPHSVVLLSSDVFGHQYAADLLRGMDGSRTLRTGDWALQKRNYEMMRPLSGKVGPPNGTLPHFMGVHSYVTVWSEQDVISVDLRIHNGTSGHDKQSPIDDPQAELYFRSLELRVPPGWQVIHDFNDPFVGKRQVLGPWLYYPIVAPNPAGKMHVLPQQGQFHRRIVIAKASQKARGRSLVSEEWLGFARRGSNPSGNVLWSWWNPLTARYWPQRQRLPNLNYAKPGSVDARIDFKYDMISQAILTGTPAPGFIYGDVLGWAHPWGSPYGGQTGGTEIFLYDGILTANAASRAGYQLDQLTLRAYVDRQPIALYDKDGDATRLSQWVIHGANFDYVNMSFFLTLLHGSNDPFGFDQAPLFQVNHVQQQKLEPDYQTELMNFKPIDLQHAIRFTRTAKTLAWLGNDALAKDELRMFAEIVRLSYHDLPSSPNGGSLPSSMRNDMERVQQHPGIGLAFGRGEGWNVDTMAAAYSVTTDQAWRTEATRWFDKVARIVNVGQATCSGHIMRQTSTKIFPNKYAARKSTETSIIENALWGALQSVYQGVDAGHERMLKQTLIDSFYAMISFPNWSNVHQAPWNDLAVADVNAASQPFCGTVPHDGVSNGVDKFQVWSSFAYASELTGDPVFLSRALDMSGTNDLKKFLEKLNFSNIENQSALMAFVQGP